MQADLVFICSCHWRTRRKRNPREAGEEERRAKVVGNERPRRRKKNVCRGNSKSCKRIRIEKQRKPRRTCSTRERRPNAVMFWVPGAGVLAAIWFGTCILAGILPTKKISDVIDLVTRHHVCNEVQEEHETPIVSDYI